KVSLSYAQSRYRWGQLSFTEPSRFLSELDQSLVDIKFGIAKKPSNIDADELRGNWGGKMSYNYSKPPQPSSAKPTESIADFVPDNPKIFNEGMKVLHQRFGSGTITKLEGSGADRMATINFENAGEKKLVLKFAKLKAITE